MAAPKMRNGRREPTIPFVVIGGAPKLLELFRGVWSVRCRFDIGVLSEPVIEAVHVLGRTRRVVRVDVNLTQCVVAAGVAVVLAANGRIRSRYCRRHRAWSDR